MQNEKRGVKIDPTLRLQGLAPSPSLILNRNCVHYDCNVSLQIEYVQMYKVLSLYVRYTYSTPYSYANTCIYTRNVGGKYCTCTRYIQTLSVNQWERRKNGKYKYANIQELYLSWCIHATKVSCNVVLLEIPIF